MSGAAGVIAGFINRALDIGIAANRSFLVNDLAGRRVTVPVPLIAASQDIRTAEAVLGPELAVDGYTRVTLWAQITHQASNSGYSFRCVGKHTSGGSSYYLPIYNPVVTASPYYINADWEYITMVRNASQYVALTWDVANTIPFIQFSVFSATENNPYGAVTSAYVTYGWGS